MLLSNSNNNNNLTPDKQINNSNIDDPLDKLMEISNRKSATNGKAPRAPSSSSLTSREKKSS